MSFNLTGLTEIYAEAIKRNDPTLAFEIDLGCGRFIFLMFFSQEDVEAKDRLFLQLGNTQVLLELKVYGSHAKGDFKIFFKITDENAIRKELGIFGGKRPFIFENFLHELNKQIPKSLPRQAKLDKLREVWPEVKHHLSKVVDEADKVYLIGTKSLPEGRFPRYKTLRKLYIYMDDSAEAVDAFIAALQNARMTLAWTANKNFERRSLSEMTATMIRDRQTLEQA